MDRRRACEIASSKEMVNVSYNDTPIFIEDVNPTKDAASIHYLNQPGRSQEVSLSQLKEYE